MNPKFISTMTTSGLLFNQLLLEKTTVTLILDRGEKLSGQLTGWDEHYLVLVSGSKLQVVPTWRLLWLESELEQTHEIIDDNVKEPEKVAVIFNNPNSPQPQSEIPESIRLEIAAGSTESSVDPQIGIAQEIKVTVQDTDTRGSQEIDNKSPLDHLEQLVKNW